MNNPSNSTYEKHQKLFEEACLAEQEALEKKREDPTSPAYLAANAHCLACIDTIDRLGLSEDYIRFLIRRNRRRKDPSA